MSPLTALICDREEWQRLVQPDLLANPGTCWCLDHAAFAWVCGKHEPHRVHLVFAVQGGLPGVIPSEWMSAILATYEAGGAIMLLAGDRESIDRAITIVNAMLDPPAGAA